MPIKTYERVMVDGKWIVGPADNCTENPAEVIARINAQSAHLKNRRGKLIYDQKPSPKGAPKPRKNTAKQLSWDYDKGRESDLINFEGLGDVLEMARPAEIRERG
jgi:hypothetical protein